MVLHCKIKMMTMTKRLLHCDQRTGEHINAYFTSQLTVADKDFLNWTFGIKTCSFSIAMMGRPLVVSDFPPPSMLSAIIMGSGKYYGGYIGRYMVGVYCLVFGI